MDKQGNNLCFKDTFLISRPRVELDSSSGYNQIWAGHKIFISEFRNLGILHCTKNSKQIFPESKLCGFVPNFCIHVSVSHLYIPTMGPPILLYCVCGLIVGIYKSLEAAQFHFWEYFFQFLAQCIYSTVDDSVLLSENMQLSRNWYKNRFYSSHKKDCPFHDCHLL